jgi:hypothetical protein
VDPELERFKTEIDLRQFAASLGYTLDARESWRASAVMRLGTDKVIIKQENDGHYVYCSVRDARDKGTVIDFIRFRTGKNLGEVRKTLRPWIGTPERNRPPLPLTNLPALVQSSKNRLQAETEWMLALPYSSSAFLEQERLIPADLAIAPRFAGCLRVDSRSNVLCLHEDIDGQLCGFEKKNKGFTGFSAGGEKGLGRSNDFGNDRRIIFSESFVDFLSYAVLFPDPAARYRSIAGGLNPKQPDIIRRHIMAMPAGSEVVAAMDADEAGRAFAGVLESIAGEISGCAFRVELPPAEGEDWNDVLRRTRPPFPAARVFLRPFPTGPSRDFNS